ncbi:tetratricopeptide repeat protein [Labilibacter marinus]|uniref:tetratricopeptide repeat protein n=1 Tax=Labilibacter marinus TaxID=1477105 RepID=UPI000950168A|nr:tetratricopeptide repeat protein [Labilibacter marinus]
MKGLIDKYILFFLMACLLIIMPILSLDAGISGDEEVHYKQAEMVIDYFSSFGKDRSAINTPVTNLKYYGQSFDNITTLLAKILNIKDIYTFRHICNSIIGWLCILFSALIAIRLSGYKTAIFVVVILAASPRFIGHSLNNLKDIPFALGYIASIYYMLNVLDDIKKIKNRDAIDLTLSMAFILSIRPGGLLVFCYFGLFSLIAFIYNYKQITTNQFWKITLKLLLILFGAYFIGLLFWPYALENPIVNPIKSLIIMSDYPVILRQLFEGKVYWSDQLPWYYLIKYVLISIPLVVIPLSLIYVSYFIKNVKKGHHIVAQSLLLFSVVFPFVYTIVFGSNVYGAWRHLLFTYLPLVVIASSGLSRIIAIIKYPKLKVAMLGVFILTLLPSFNYIIKNPSLSYTYFNRLAGNAEKVGQNYELDYYYHSVREASLWLTDHLKEDKSDQIKIASNYGIGDYFKLSDKNINYKYTPYYERGNRDWDYGIFYRTTIAPSQTSEKLWPPVGTLKCIYAGETPVCVIVKRQTKTDYFGKLAYEKGEYNKAIDLLNEATQLDPVNEIAWINLGKSHLRLNQLQSAKKAFKQCLKIIPDYEPSIYYLAEVENQLGNTDKSRVYYQKIINNNNKSFKTYLAYAKLEKDLNKDEHAVELLDMCLKINPTYKPAILLKEEIHKK